MRWLNNNKVHVQNTCYTTFGVLSCNNILIEWSLPSVQCSQASHAGIQQNAFVACAVLYSKYPREVVFDASRAWAQRLDAMSN